MVAAERDRKPPASHPREGVCRRVEMRVVERQPEVLEQWPPGRVCMLRATQRNADHRLRLTVAVGARGPYAKATIAAPHQIRRVELRYPAKEVTGEVDVLRGTDDSPPGLGRDGDPV